MAEKKFCCVRYTVLKTKHFILMAVLFILSLPVFGLAAGAVDLPKTGQTTCYDSAGTVIACTGTGQDGEILAGVSWPNPRFTDNGNSTVTDNLTGLVWTKDGKTSGSPVCTLETTTKTWQGALDYVACLNATSYLGYTDWRLPNINELKSLTHAGQSDTAAWLNTQGFNNVQSGYYWSSTSYASYPDDAWIVNMWHGYVSSNGKSYSVYYVWPVRSGQSGLFGTSIIRLPRTGQTTCYDTGGNIIPCAGTGQDGDLQSGFVWPNPRFTDNGDGTVTDNLTALVWTKDGNAPGPAACSPATTKTWQAALDFAACLNTNSYLGYTDWRLPNINELKSVTHAGQSDSAAWLNTEGFSNMQSYYYWSSTSGAGYPGGAWIVLMWDGYVYDYYKSVYGYVWPVRSGQVGPLVHSIIGAVTENGTGLGNVTMTLSGASSATTTTAGDGSYSFKNLPDGNYTITPAMNNYNFTPTNRSVTVAGADVFAQDFVAEVLDTIPPTGSILINNNAVWTKTKNVTLTINCTDDAGGSGCAEMQLSDDGFFDTEPWEPYGTSKAWTLSSNGLWIRSVYIRFRDAAGNISIRYSDSIKLDMAIPLISNVSVTPNSFKPRLGQKITLSFTVSDNMSPTCDVSVKIYDATSVLLNNINKTGLSCNIAGTTTSVTWFGKDKIGTLVPAGTYTYKIQAKDQALNYSIIQSGTVTVQ